MQMLNTAKFREKLPKILKRVQKEKKPFIVGRFGEPKAVLIDIQTFSWQQQVLDYLSRLDKLTKNEVETLEILLDKKTREMLFQGLSEIEKGETITLDNL